MNLFLLRHAVPDDAYPDFDRSLTQAGYAQISSLCGHLPKERFCNLSKIFHSPLRRAVQTAGSFVLGMGLDASLLAPNDDLCPMSTPVLIARQIASSCACRKDLMIVGHNPHLEGLARLLLAAQSDYFCLRFRNCSLACFSLESAPGVFEELGTWNLAAFMDLYLLS